MCKVLGIARSEYYYQRNKKKNRYKEANEKLDNDKEGKELIKEASIKSNGNGGGSKVFGQGGGTDITYVDEILENVKHKIGELWDI